MRTGSSQPMPYRKTVSVMNNAPGICAAPHSRHAPRNVSARFEKNPNSHTGTQ